MASLSGASFVLSIVGGTPTRYSIVVSLAALICGALTGIASIVTSVAGYSSRAHITGTLAKGTFRGCGNVVRFRQVNA